MNVEPVDLGEEIGIGVQLRLALPPVVIGRPIPRERLNEGELHALRKIADGFLLRESRRHDAPAQFDQFCFRNIHTKRSDRGLVSYLFAARWCSGGLGHGVLSQLSSVDVFIRTA